MNVVGRGRRGERVPLGRVHVLLGSDDHAYVRTTHLSDVGYGSLVAMAAVAWAVRTTLTSSSWRPEQVSAFLARACAAEEAAAHARSVGLLASTGEQPPLGTRGPTASVQLARSADRRLEATWTVPPASDTVPAATRSFAALWEVATQHGAEEVVRHALYTLRGGFEQNGAFEPSVADELIAPLLAFGLDMAATESRARDSRRGFRVVR